MLSNHLILCRPLLLLPSIFPSIRVFSSETAHYLVAKVLELQLQHQSFQLIFRTVSFRIDWFDLLAIQRTLKSFPQHHNSKASIFWHSAFFMVQLSHLYMTTGETTVLTVCTLLSKMMSLLFNMLSSFVIAFLPRSLLHSKFLSQDLVLGEFKLRQPFILTEWARMYFLLLLYLCEVSWTEHFFLFYWEKN